MRRRHALVLLAALVVVALPATAAGSPGRQGPAPDGEPDAPVELVSQTTWIEPDGEVRLRLDADGADPADRLTVTIHSRLLARYQLTDSIEDGPPGRALRTIVDATIGELDPDGDGEIDVRLGLRAGPGDPERLLISQEGLHPVHVTSTSAADGTATSFTTHVARVPAEVEQTLGLTVVQPLATSLSLRPDGTVQIPESTRRRLTDAAAVYADAEIPVTFTVAAETLTALSRSGNPLDADLLTSLATAFARGSLAASTFVDIDPDSLVRAGLGDLVDAQLEHGATSVNAHVGQLPDTSTWVADDDLGPTGLGALLDAGVGRVVVPHADLVGDIPSLLVQPFALRSDAGLVTALATEPGLQSHLSGDSPDVLAAQHLLADLAAVWFERPAYARATALVLPEEVPDRPVVTTLLEGLAGSPLLRVGPLDQVVDAADPAAAGGIDAQVQAPADRLVLDLEPSERPRLSAAYPAELRRTRAAVESSRTVFPDAEATDLGEDRLAVTAAASMPATERLDRLEAIQQQLAERHSHVAMPERGAITLPSRDGVIPLTLVNNTGLPATVVISFASDKLEFRDGERVELTLVDQLTSIEVPVRARASGAFPLEMRLESPDGRTVFVDSRYTIRSTAVSGLGVVLSATAVVVLGAWWVRTARRARAAHRAAQ